MMLEQSLDAAQLAQDLDPRDHIDRRAEQELFRTLVTFETPARILVICDRGGRGKSSLLKRLRYNCDYEIKPPVPSYLVEVDNDKIGAPSPFAFASAVVRGFTVRGEENVQARFAKFNELDAARIAKDFTPFEGGGGARRTDAYGPSGRAYTGTMLGGQTIGTQTNINHADVVHVAGVPEFSEEQEQLARDACVAAFFDDLRSICSTRPMVLILDGWERCNSTLSAWIVDRVLANHMLHPNPELRPQKLAVVIAGRPYVAGETRYVGLRADEFRQLFDSQDEFAATVRSIRSLSEWDSSHIRDFMVLNGCPEPTEVEISTIRGLLAGQGTLVQVREAIGTFFGGQVRR